MFTCTGMLILTVTNPIWVVKTRLCLSHTASVPSYKRYTGLRDGLYKLYQYEGLQGLYRGFIPGLWGTSHGAIQFMFYEELKRLYTVHYCMTIDAKLVCTQAVIIQLYMSDAADNEYKVCSYNTVIYVRCSRQRI